MDMEKKNSGKLFLIAIAAAVVIVAVFVLLRGGFGPERSANDVSSLIPKVTEQTPPLPPGVPTPVNLGDLRKESK